MALNEKKLKRMLEKSEQLERRIKESADEKKRLEAEIKIVSYDNLMAELTKRDMVLDDEFFYTLEILQKIRENGLSIEDIDKITDEIIKSKENDDEKKIY